MPRNTIAGSEGVCDAPVRGRRDNNGKSCLFGATQWSPDGRTGICDVSVGSRANGGVVSAGPNDGWARREWVAYDLARNR